MRHEPSMPWVTTVLLAIVTFSLAGGVFPAKAALGPATILGPAAGGGAHSETPELSWTSVAGASHYRVQVATDSGFATTIYQADTVATRHVPSIDLDPGTLYWRVAALADGIAQAWASSSFVKSPGLATPVLVGPADGSVTEYPAATVFSWTAAPGAGGYDIHVTGSATINDQPIRIATTSVALQVAGETVTWRVRAVSTNGRTVGAWSESRTVSGSWTTAPPLLLPPDGGDPIREAYLTWRPIPGARRFDVQVTPLPADWTSSRTVTVTSQVPAHRFVDPHTAGGGAYAWRVRGVDAAGQAGPWTTARTFEIALSPKPQLLGPGDRSAQTSYPILRWTPVVRASHYFVDISTDPAFGSMSASIRTTEPELVVTGDASGWIPQSGTTYYWRVRAIDDPGGRLASEPSEGRSFTLAPPAIAQLAPGDGARVTVPTFTWEPGWGVRYRVTVTDASGVVDQGEVAGPAYTARVRLPTGELRWRVEALDWTGAVTNRSDWRTVIVDEPEPTTHVPTITSPAGARGWAPPTLTWTPVVGAVSYDIEYACDTCGTLNAVPVVYPAFTYDGPWHGRERFDYQIVAYGASGEFLAESEPSHFFWDSPPLATGLAVTSCVGAPCTVSDTARFSWLPITGAERYGLEIYQTGDAIPLASYSVLGTSFRPTLDLPDGDFTWRVKACVVARCSTLQPTVGETHAFAKAVPAAVGTSTPDSTVFTDYLTVAWGDWLGAPDPRGQHQSEAKDYGTGSGSQPGDGLHATILTSASEVVWSVRASYDTGMGGTHASPPSEPRSFTIERPAPAVAWPLAAAVVDYTPTLVWEPRALARWYEVELYRGDGTSMDPESLVWRTERHLSTAWNTNELGAGTYAWRVRADMGDAGFSDWSAVRTFDIAPSPTAVTAPASGGSVDPSVLTVTWTRDDRAEGYRVELSTDSTFANAHESVVTAATRWVPTIALGPGTWHWRVTPLSASALPLGEATSSFVVEAPPTPTPTPTPSPTPTPDPSANVVDIEGHQFEADVRWLYGTGITRGCSPDRFCPDHVVTRAQMASFLARALALPNSTADYFTDDETSGHEADINRIAAAGITLGCGPRRFCPDDVVTRAQMASFLARALALPPTSTDYFTDDETSGHEADINRFRAAGITYGCSPTTFCPGEAVTRGQMAAFLHRALE